MACRKIEFFRTSAGRCPVEEFIDSLSSAEAQRIVWLLELFRDFENIPAPYFKKLQRSDEIWEGRIQYGNRSFRVLGFFRTGSTFVVTNGFSKKSRKIPRQEIETAERYKREYYVRTKTRR